MLDLFDTNTFLVNLLRFFLDILQSIHNILQDTSIFHYTLSHCNQQLVHTLRTVHQHSFRCIVNKIEERIHTSTQQIDVLAIERGNKRLVQFLVQLSGDHISTMLVLLDVLVQRFLFFRVLLL